MGPSVEETVIATYRVPPAHEQAFVELLRRHHPTLVRRGLATPTAAQVYRGDEDGRPVFVEIFTWRDAAAVEAAHHDPEVMPLWEAMGRMVEERGGRPGFEFPHVRRLQLGS